MSHLCEARVWNNDANDVSSIPHGITANHTIVDRTDTGEEVVRHLCKMHLRIQERSNHMGGVYGCRYAAKRGGFHGYLGEPNEYILLSVSDVSGDVWYRNGWKHEVVSEDSPRTVVDPDDETQVIHVVKIRRTYIG